MVELLFAPWRMTYILADKKEQRCIFCPMDGRSDRERLILRRTPRALVMLNRYPYSYAHLMVAPVRHVDQVKNLKKTEMTDILFHLGQSIEILKKAFHPDGFNVGMNLGRVAGAGVLHHLHFHIVPRWNGDTNFMPAVGEVRVIPEHLKETYRRLSPFFRKTGK
ncbi:MAG: HIT domain-containing protein [Syntrophaceae bacterium]|jgi:ATP adenylyltransferase|nr:HIT domain-containing protein [Syntrophaceae bacterium]